MPAQRPRDPLLERERDRPFELELVLRADDPRERLLVCLLLELLRPELELDLLLPPPLSSSSPPNSASFAPSSTPLVFLPAPPSSMSPNSSGSDSPSSTCVRSSRLTASAKRRYVSTLAM